MPEEINHEEKAPFSLSIKILLAIFLLLLITPTTISILTGSSKAEGIRIIVLVTILLALTFNSFFKMKYRISKTGVQAIMPPFSYTVQFTEIEKIYIDTIPWWIGWGLRIWKRRIGFISMHKSSVHIKKRKGFFRTFILSVKEPEPFIKMIGKYSGFSTGEEELA